MTIHLAGLVFLLGCASLLEAGAELSIGNDGLPVTDLAPHLSIMRDPTTELGICDVLAGRASGFVPNTRKVPSFGFTRDAVWFRFEIRSESDSDQSIVAALGTARLAHFTWHVVDEGRVEQSVACGAADAEVPRQRVPRINFRIPAGAKRTIYARAESDTSIWLQLRAGSPDVMERLESGHSAWDHLLIGFCGSVLFFSFLFGFFQRQKLYFYLTCLAASYLFYYTVFNGYARTAWPGMPFWFERGGFGLFSALGTFVFMRFNGAYLNLRAANRAVRTLQRVAEVLGFTSVFAFVVLDFFLAIRLLSPLLVLGVLLQSIVIASMVRRFRRPEEIWFLSTWIGFGVLMIILGLQFSGILPVIIPFSWLQLLMIPAILTGFFLSVVARQRSIQELEVHLAESRQAEADARLSALRYQINPHFLFNTLASVEALSHIAPERIPGLVSRLATFLRLRLVPSPTLTAPFEQELETVRAYLDIEHTRFGDGLTATYDIASDSLSCLMPEFMLQPLAENAVKYGFECDKEVRIHVESRVRLGKLIITIANRGVLTTGNVQASGLGVGTENIRQRLAMHYGADADFRITQQGETVVARIEIPEERSPR